MVWIVFLCFKGWVNFFNICFCFLLFMIVIFEDFFGVVVMFYVRMGNFCKGICFVCVVLIFVIRFNFWVFLVFNLFCFLLFLSISVLILEMVVLSLILFLMLVDWLESMEFLWGKDFLWFKGMFGGSLIDCCLVIVEWGESWGIVLVCLFENGLVGFGIVFF